VSVPVLFREAARAEFDEAYDWNESQRLGSGVIFADRVQRVLDQIGRAPETFAAVFQDVRRAVVPKYPYTSLYTIETDRVVVLAVFHGKRDPRIWQSRVEHDDAPD